MPIEGVHDQSYGDLPRDSRPRENRNFPENSPNSEALEVVKTTEEAKDKLSRLEKFLEREMKKPNTIETHMHLNNDLNEVKGLSNNINKYDNGVTEIEEYEKIYKEITILRAQYKLELLKSEIQAQEEMKTQVRYQAQEFFQDWAKTKPDMLRENGPSAKNIDRKRLVDNGRTGKGMDNESSIARNIALLNAMKQDSEKFKNDFISAQGDGKRYRDGFMTENQNNIETVEDEFPNTFDQLFDKINKEVGGSIVTDVVVGADETDSKQKEQRGITNSILESGEKSIILTRGGSFEMKMIKKSDGTLLLEQEKDGKEISLIIGSDAPSQEALKSFITKTMKQLSIIQSNIADQNNEKIKEFDFSMLVPTDEKKFDDMLAGLADEQSLQNITKMA